MNTKPIQIAIDKYNLRIKNNGEVIQRLQIRKKDLNEKLQELQIELSQIDKNTTELIKESYQMQGAAEALTSLLGQLEVE